MSIGRPTAFGAHALGAGQHARMAAGAAWLPALAGALAVARGAILGLRPRDGLIEPDPVDVQDYFSAEDIARARRDAFSLALTDASEPFISFEQRIVRQNLADPAPPRWLVRLMGSHPPAVQRIGIARAYARGVRPSG